MPKIGIGIPFSVCLACVSLCFLTKYLIDSWDQLTESTKLKLFCLFFEHFFVIYMIAQLAHCNTSEDYVSWMTYLSTTIFLTVTIVETIDVCVNDKFMFLRAFRHRTNHLDKVYLSLWLNVYFETWLYSFTCILILGCTFCLTNITEYCRSRRRLAFL